MKKTSIEKLNEELANVGIDVNTIKDKCVARTKYITHLSESIWDDKDWVKELKALKADYLLAFHDYFAQKFPNLLFELSEDKVYWIYNEEEGIYNEINFTIVRGFVLKLMIDEGLQTSATESNAKNILARFRSVYSNRGKEYDDFDNNGSLFHVKNGWVDVNTLEFTPHSSDKLSRRVSSVSYDFKATCPMYDKFLDEQMQIAPDQVKAIDQFSGLLLTPDITKQKMLVLIGKPGCGKSTLLDLWSDVLGDCATQKGLTEIASESFRFGGSSLVGKTLCWFDEVEVTRHNVGSSLINLVTGQQLHIERKGINGIIEAQNKLKCVLTANTLPRSAEMGIYRRMILIYLNYSFYDNMTDNKNIRQILRDESSGVLNRMLRGLADLNRNKGFVTIDGHDDLIEDYKTSSNTIAEFLDEHFTFDYNAPNITSKALLEAYQKYSNDKYSNSLTPQRFGVLMSQNGLSKFDKITASRGTAGMRMWSGLKLKPYYEINKVGLIREKADEIF